MSSTEIERIIKIKNNNKNVTQKNWLFFLFFFHSLFLLFFFSLTFHMTDSNSNNSSQKHINSDRVDSLEEGDITEVLSNIHLARKPSPANEERLHNTEDSESEEDLTEEHVDTHLLATQVENSGVNNTPQDSLESVEQHPSHEQVDNGIEDENRNSNAGTLHPSEQQEQREPNEDTISPLAPTVNSTQNSNSNRGRSVSSVSPSTTPGLLPRSQRVWEMDRQAPECRRCHRRFNFLVRRHHCR